MKNSGGAMEKSLENKIEDLLEQAKKEFSLKLERIIRDQKGTEEEINTGALQICPACGKKNLVLYAVVNQPSKLFCLGCGRYWEGGR